MRKPDAPPKKVDVAPSDSVINRTAPYLDEVATLDSRTLESFNVLEVDRRIALLSRMVLESALRADPAHIPLKDRADLALRAINTLEGARSRSDLWKKEESAPVPIDVEAYEVEVKETEQRMEKLLARSKQRATKKHADKALEVMGEEEEME